MRLLAASIVVAGCGSESRLSRAGEEVGFDGIDTWFIQSNADDGTRYWDLACDAGDVFAVAVNYISTAGHCVAPIIRESTRDVRSVERIWSDTGMASRVSAPTVATPPDEVSGDETS